MRIKKLFAIMGALITGGIGIALISSTIQAYAAASGNGCNGLLTALAHGGNVVTEVSRACGGFGN